MGMQKLARWGNCCLISYWLIYLGQITIPLRDACGDRPVVFELPLLYEGRPQGFISGKVHVQTDGVHVSSKNGPSSLSISATPSSNTDDPTATLPFTSASPYVTSPASIRRGDDETTHPSSLPVTIPPAGEDAFHSASPSNVPFPSPPSPSGVSSTEGHSFRVTKLLDDSP